MAQAVRDGQVLHVEGELLQVHRVRDLSLDVAPPVNHVPVVGSFDAVELIGGTGAHCTDDFEGRVPLRLPVHVHAVHALLQHLASLAERRLPLLEDNQVDLERFAHRVHVLSVTIVQRRQKVHHPAKW